MSSDRRAFVCAMMNWNQKHSLVEYKNVQCGTDLLMFQRDKLSQFTIL